MSDDSVTPRVDGARVRDGRFGPGNGYGRGNPNLKRIHALTTRLVNATTDEIMDEISRGAS